MWSSVPASLGAEMHVYTNCTPAKNVTMRDYCTLLLRGENGCVVTPDENMRGRESLRAKFSILFLVKAAVSNFQINEGLLYSPA